MEKPHCVATTWVLYGSKRNIRLIRRFSVNQVKYVAERESKKGNIGNRITPAKKTIEV